MAKIPCEYSGGGTLGTPVTLTDVTPYKCPSDGYAYINQSTASSGYITINSNIMAFSGSSNVVPVKRGWTITLHQSGTLFAAQFIPLID